MHLLEALRNNMKEDYQAFIQRCTAGSDDEEHFFFRQKGRQKFIEAGHIRLEWDVTKKALLNRLLGARMCLIY